MAKSSISKRVIFPNGKQKYFLLKTRNILNLSWLDLSKLLKISNRTLTDWKREKFSIPLTAAKILAKKAKIKIPKYVKIKDSYWYTKKGARLGGLAMIKKYGQIGDPDYRKKKWREWWKNTGKHKINIISKPKTIFKPVFSRYLAEFVGIVLGDGGISKYQIIITLHRKDDKKYSIFVIKLLKKLFRIKARYSYKKESLAMDIYISRIKLVSFCLKKLGLVQGNKIRQKIDIPDWIKENKLYSIACVRGLFDTDGCVIKHRYRVNSKLYCYKKLGFTSHSKPLRESVYHILKDNNIKSRLAGNKDVRIDSIKDVKNYFEIVGSHNPKHLKRYQN